MKQCQQCGTSVGDESPFCSGCGARFQAWGWQQPTALVPASRHLGQQRPSPVIAPPRQNWIVRWFLWSKYGGINSHLICPHCQTKGFVRAKRVRRKRGISGGKATAAIFTGGLSLLATGLSRKEGATQARCGQCSSQWDF